MITESQIQQVQELSSLFFSLEEISLLTLIDIEELRREVQFGKTDLSRAYWNGKLTTLKTMRASVKTNAEKGNSMANFIMNEWLKEMNESESK